MPQSSFSGLHCSTAAPARGSPSGGNQGGGGKSAAKAAEAGERRILDVGCGAGSKVPLLLPRGKVTAVDINEGALAAARSYCPGAEYLKMSAEALSFPAGSFDEVHFYDCLEHVDDLEGTLGEASRVLKTGGLLIAEVPHPDSEGLLMRLNPDYPVQAHHRRVFTDESAVNALNRHGFKVERAFYVGFWDSVYLSLIFLGGHRIDGQLGAVSKDAPETRMDRIARFVLLSTQLPKALLEDAVGKKGIEEAEEAFGMPLEDMLVFIQAVEGVGTRLFPKSLRFECVKAGGNVKQDAGSIEWARIPEIPGRIFSGESLRKQVDLRDEGLSEKQVALLSARNKELLEKFSEQEERHNAKSAELLKKFEEQEKHYSSEISRLKSQLEMQGRKGQSRRGGILSWLR